MAARPPESGAAECGVGFGRVVEQLEEPVAVSIGERHGGFLGETAFAACKSGVRFAPHRIYAMNMPRAVKHLLNGNGNCVIRFVIHYEAVHED